MPVNRAAQPAVEINAADFGGSLLSLGIGAAYISRSALDYAEPRKAPLVFAAYDKRLPVIVGPGEIWAGLAVSYNAYSSAERHDVRFVPRVSYVCQLTSDAQVYGALGAGWRHSFGYPLTRSALYLAPVAGVRYSLRSRLGLFAEAGYDATVLKFGVCFQPRQQRPPNEWLHTAKDGSLQKKEFALSAGIGVGQFAVPDIEFSPVSYRRSPLFLASLDQGLVSVGRTGMISFGLTVAFRTTRFDSMVGDISYDEFFTTGRIAYNAPLFQRLNTYAGVAAGGKMSASSAATTTGIEPVADPFVGLRYALIDRSGVFCEAGTDAALLRLGIFYFLHC
ncbi:MAG: hypothetical protein H7330_06870 [Hymenobacteraceae bacterium]|nr:hypothetical protein [Hymenobacteraceae bacterium]